MTTRALVVGAGLIGTSLAMALRQAGWAVLVDDADPQRVRMACALGAGEPYAEGQRVDLAVVAVPPEAIAPSLARLQRLDVAAAYTDVGSVKSRPQLEAEAEGCEMSTFVGGHPVAGRERSGPAAARPDLFVGRPWVLVPHRASEAAVQAVTAMVHAVGAIPVRMTADEHDTALATLSHLPQIVASAVAAALLELPDDAMPLAGQGLRDTVRIAASDPRLWGQIAAANAGPLAAALGRLSRTLGETGEVLSAGQGRARDAVASLVELGNRGHERIPGKHGGRRATYRSVAVVVPDTPGQLAGLLTAAAEAGFNVEDISVEHAPGRPAGVIELWVQPAVAEDLHRLLTSTGWDAYLAESMDE